MAAARVSDTGAVSVYNLPSSPKKDTHISETNAEKHELLDGVKDPDMNSDGDLKSEMNVKEFVADMLKKLKLNPQAKEFFPSYYHQGQTEPYSFVPIEKHSDDRFLNNRGKKTNNNNGKKRIGGRAFKAQREDSIRRTVYVSDIDHNITEEQIAALFCGYGQVVDCRVCGDPNSRHRFAFVEFADEQSARGAISLSGTLLSYSPIKVLPSKTAILPVNPTFLPRSKDEREMCARTVYCTNIDRMVSDADVKNFFEAKCGEVSRLRLLGDQTHSTRIAFVEFFLSESATLALDCCGQMLGSQRIRVSPSKTPVRPRVTRPGMQ